jgi:hypothetical protein
MDMQKNDYIQILNYYKESIPRTTLSLQKKAEKILSLKLCRCIKKIDSKKKNEAKSIGICTKTIFNRKGLTRGNFKCKGNRRVNFTKTRKLKKSILIN